MSRLCRLKTESHGEDGKWAYEEIVKLRSELSALQGENEKLLATNAALELEVASLRNVMADVIKAHGYAGGTPIEVMSTPFTPTALNELIEKVERRTIERCIGRVQGFHYLSANFKALEEELQSLPTGQISLEELL